MNPRKLTYIEEAGLYFEKMGMTRMAGRIFGFLVVCDCDAASFDEIKEALDASKGSISTNLKQLLQAGLVEVQSLPGNRRTYYRVNKMPFSDLMRARMKFMTEFSTLLTKAQALKEREDDVSLWLTETAAFYLWMEAHIEEMMRRWDLEKDEFIQNRRDR
jgi:DNA-binding transcriptional regulator GbsR (MarR family)